MNVDLSKFCSTNPSYPNLSEPFSRAGYTWATNGAIMLRVALRDDVPEIKESPHAERVWTDASDPFVPVSPFEIPTGPTVECGACEGRGTKHSCPNCDCACGQCRGDGVIEERRAVSVGPLCIDRRYAVLVMTLPGLEVEIPKASGDRVHFRFEGGAGVVMILHGISSNDAFADLMRGDVR